MNKPPRYTIVTGALAESTNGLGDPSGEWMKAADYDALLAVISDETLKYERVLASNRELGDAIEKAQRLSADYETLCRAKDRRFGEVVHYAEQLYEAVERAQMFIENGIEMGFIRMPEYKADPAHETVRIVEAAVRLKPGAALSIPSAKPCPECGAAPGIICKKPTCPALHALNGVFNAELVAALRAGQQAVRPTLNDLVPGKFFEVEHMGTLEFVRWDTYHGERTAEFRGITHPGTYNLLPDDFLARVKAPSAVHSQVNSGGE